MNQEMTARLKQGFGNIRIIFLGLALLILMTVALWALGNKTIFNNHASSNSVLVTLAPNAATLPATVKIYVDPQGSQLVFTRLVINFDKAKLKLIANPSISSRFQNEIKKTVMADANPSGKIELVAGIDPSSTPITGAQEFATLMFDKNDASVVTSSDNVSFSVADSQIVALPETALSINATGAKLQTAVVADTTAPSTAITAPSSGSSVHGTVDVVANASDNVGVTKVEFYVDGVNKGTVQSSPYSFSWNTTGFANGAHSLSSKAYDAAGNTKSSANVSVAVSNAVSDTTLPTTAITSPASGTTVHGLVSVVATATDNVAVTKVELYVGTTKLDTISAAPYSFNWETSGFANGSYVLTTKAYDGANNVKTSAAVSVTVSNTAVADTTEPTTAITVPAAGSTVKGSVDVSATATDNVGVTKVEFYVDSAIKNTDQASPYSFSWDTTSGVANGIHSLSSKAYDAAGNYKTSALVNVSVANSATKEFHCGTKGDPGCYDVVGDGEINISDWSSFSNRYGASVDSNASCTAAGQLACINCNSDSIINIFDFACFAKVYLKKF